jgi:Etoposide-induced protein 2.4 (EI24)
LISPHRVIYPDASTAVKMLGKPTSPAIYTPWSVIQILELIVFLPLNLIPFFGTPAFIIITGTRLGKLSHYRWFQLRGFGKQDRKREIRKLAWEDVWFGTVAMILELIPILSFVFLLTTTAGAALWTASIEDERRDVVVATISDTPFNEDEDEDDDDELDAPPPYSDHV